ncbi:MAG TPA: 50S ribosomal protein L6 [Phycisphaerae bacterium]|nr:50S ribosomal protein L6 [Phycisphaerae bacterium]HNU44468.1 50S ribosomal protein L6 [Phycisphaerae bacterium]
MSRVGKQPVAVPPGITVKVAGQRISVKGPRGELTWEAPPTAAVSFDERARVVSVTRAGNDRQSRANHGLARALIANMVRGAATGFERRLEIYGTGYNCKLQGKVLHLNVGYSGRNRGRGSQYEVPVPDGVEVVVEVPAARGDNEPAKVLIKGTDKQKVGQFAAEVRAIRKTEPYRGKGIRYEGEHIKRKQGKALSGTG